MTLNDLIKKAQALSVQFSTGDIPLDKDIDFTVAKYKDCSYGIIVDVNTPKK